MPLGTGAIALRNLPVSKYNLNPGLFNQLTNRIVFDPINFSIPGFGNYVQNQLLQVGIVSKIRLYFSGSVTTTGSTVTIAPTAHWPWNLINVKVSGNGQNNFISADGLDLKIRSQIQNRALEDQLVVYPNSSSATPFNTAASANVVLWWDVPIAMDDTTLVGSLYAQSEATNLTYTVTTRAQSDLFNVTAGTVAVTGTIYLEETVFDVPYDPTHPDTLVIPDLTVLHGYQSNENAVASQSTLDTYLIRINGQLERLVFYTIDLSTAAAPVFTASATYSLIQLIYGANTTPYTFQPGFLLKIRNVNDYRNAIGWDTQHQGTTVTSGAAVGSGVDGLFCLDMINENPARDNILLEGVTNLRLRTTYSSAPTGGSKVHFVQETLFA
jgi:hypothetical protein